MRIVVREGKGIDSIPTRNTILRFELCQIAYANRKPRVLGSFLGCNENSSDKNEPKIQDEVNKHGSLLYMDNVMRGREEEDKDTEVTETTHEKVEEKIGG